MSADAAPLISDLAPAMIPLGAGGGSGAAMEDAWRVIVPLYGDSGDEGDFDGRGWILRYSLNQG